MMIFTYILVGEAPIAAYLHKLYTFGAVLLDTHEWTVCSFDSVYFFIAAKQVCRFEIVLSGSMFEYNNPLEVGR